MRTDIAYLLDRVRELASDNRSLRERLKDERVSHNESLAKMHDELARYKRAHAWFVENHAHCHWPGCPCDKDCEWVKARELRL